MTSNLPIHHRVTRWLYHHFDKAFTNYEQFDLFNKRDIFFVIPEKENAAYKSIKEFGLTEEEPAILKDELM